LRDSLCGNKLLLPFRAPLHAVLLFLQSLILSAQLSFLRAKRISQVFRLRAASGERAADRGLRVSSPTVRAEE